MADTRIDAPRSAEPHTGKATAQTMASARSAAGAGVGEQEQGFSSLLASLDGFVAAGLSSPILSSVEEWGEKQTQSALPELSEQRPGFSLLLASLDGFVAAGLPSSNLSAAELPDEKLAQPALLLLSEQDALLAAQGNAPWMSLVGQTAQLDAQGDADLRQGAATDFLSGRGNTTQLAHRQALQAGDSGAHAAFMGKGLQPNQPQTQVVQAQVAINSDVAGQQGAEAQASMQVQDGMQNALAAATEEVPAARGEPAAHKAPPQIPTQHQQGISLQGMTAVQPQVMEGLKDLLRAARSPLQEEGAATKADAAHGTTDLHAAAAVVGAAMGAASAGMQGGGSGSSDLAQSMAGLDAAPSEREQEVSEQVAFWVHQKTQNAALSIQHEGRPIQVQVQLNGQEAHVRFAADDEQARQLLVDGQAQLRDLLQAQGLSLSGISVDAGGAQGQPNAGAQGGEPSGAQARVARVSVNAADVAGAELVGRSAAQVSSKGVDLFV